MVSIYNNLFHYPFYYIFLYDANVWQRSAYSVGLLFVSNIFNYLQSNNILWAVYLNTTIYFLMYNFYMFVLIYFKIEKFTIRINEIAILIVKLIFIIIY